MTATPETLRRGWCPGALRPMQSGDGLLVRIKPFGGRLTMEQAEAVVALAARFGNGLIELTQRANLQLRGVTSATLDPLIAELNGLALIDATPDAEARRNIVATPLAGLDPAAYDTRVVASTLEGRLRDQNDLAVLPDKFGFLIDGGGVLPLTDIEGDVRFVWNGCSFSVGLPRDQEIEWIGTCAADDVPGVAVVLARHFLLHAGGARRMRGLPDAAVASARLLLPQGDMSSHQVTPEAVVSIAGCLQRGPPEAPIVAVTAGLPFGGATADAMADLLMTAKRAGVREIRLTPWRAILLPAPDQQDANGLLAACEGAGLITSPVDPRRSVAACPGAPACANGSTAVRNDAETIAKNFGAALMAGHTLHVSGCAKGCARRQPADLTLVAESGKYGLVVNGTASDAPCGRFTPAEAVETLARLAAAMTKADNGDTPCGPSAIEGALKEILAA